MVSTTTDTGGGTSPTWTDVETVYVDLKPMTGKYALEVGEITQGYPVRIRTWYRTDFNTDQELTPELHRFKDGDRVYNIHLVVNVENMNRELEIIAYYAG